MHTTPLSLTERIERALRLRLAPASYCDIEPMRVEVAHLPGEPIPAAAAIALQYAPFSVGQQWGRAWSTSWFRFTGVIPDRMRGRRVELLVDLGFHADAPGFQSEGLAYTADAVPIKGVAPRTAYVPIARSAHGGEPVEIYVEAAANPRFDGSVSPLGDPDTAPDQPLYRLDRADLAVLDEPAWALTLDVKVLHELALQLAESDPRRQEIRRALEEMLDELDVADAPDAAATARARLAGVLAARAVPSAHRISAVGHAHIDSAWLWPVRETIRKCARTFSNVVTLADEYPELVFACSSAQQYAWMRDHHPCVYRRIAEKVAAGNFVPVGGMWVESDTNMPGGEAMVRQFTYGKRFFREEFGIEPHEVWLPDSFGYTAALPQLARLAGCRWFVSQKMSWNETNRFPHHTFWWEGIDGSRVFTHFPPADTYNSDLSGRQLAYAAANFAEDGRAHHSLLPFGHGDGGGGPTRDMLEVARRVADLEGSPRVAIRSPAAFFAIAEADYTDAPVWVGELYLEYHRGTYTSQAAMKQGNRRTEHLLREAELWSATAALRSGFDYPYDELDDVWRQALLLQFHDILPGSSIAWVHRQARARYAELERRLETTIDAALAALVGRGDLPLAVNAAPHERAGVAALGAAVAAASGAAVTVEQNPGGIILDNGVLRVCIGADGTVSSIRDRIAEREVLAGPANVLQLHPDKPNRFDAWNIDASYRGRCRDLTDHVKIEVDTAAADRPVVRITRHDSDSRYLQTIALRSDARLVEFETGVDWHERETLLKVAFPIDVHTAHSSSEIQFGHVRRPAHVNTSWDAARFEIWAHRWLEVAEPGYGVALVNDRTYGHDVTRRPSGDAMGAGTTTVRLSLLRGPRHPDPNTDQGEHRFGYAMVCGADISDSVREGYRANLPLRRISGARTVAPLIAVTPESVVVESVKLADDRTGDVVVRLYEALGGRAHAKLSTSFDLAGGTVCDLLERADEEIAALAHAQLDGNSVEISFGPFQVVTLRLRPAA